VQLAHDHGLGTALGVAAGAAGEQFSELQLTGVSTLGANLVDNLPTNLAMEPVADGSPLRMAALLGGSERRPADHPMGKSGDTAVDQSLSGGRPPGLLADLCPPRADRCPSPRRRLSRCARCGAMRLRGQGGRDPLSDSPVARLGRVRRDVAGIGGVECEPVGMPGVQCGFLVVHPDSNWRN
jgi:hypothetical protein